MDVITQLRPIDCMSSKNIADVQFITMYSDIFNIDHKGNPYLEELYMRMKLLQEGIESPKRKFPIFRPDITDDIFFYFQDEKRYIHINRDFALDYDSKERNILFIFTEMYTPPFYILYLLSNWKALDDITITWHSEVHDLSKDEKISLWREKILTRKTKLR